MTTGQKTADADWQKAMSGTEDITPPGSLKEGEVVNIPSEDSPAAVRVSELRYKGYVPVWDTKTGVRILQPHFFLWQTMRMKHEDGTLMYTSTDPHIPPNYGQDLMCPLNPESPDFARIQGRGFKTCRKRHIPHLDAVEAHVRSSHKRAYLALERERQDRIREEDRELQRETLRSNQELIRSVVGRPATGVSEPIDVSTTPSETDSKHVHRYGKTVGSQCRVTGCTEQRTRPYVNHKK